MPGGQGADSPFEQKRRDLERERDSHGLIEWRGGEFGVSSPVDSGYGALCILLAIRRPADGWCSEAGGKARTADHGTG